MLSTKILAGLGLVFLVPITKLPALPSSGADVWVINAKRASEQSFLSEKEKAMIFYMNLVRTDPSRFNREYVLPYALQLRKADLLKFKADEIHIADLSKELEKAIPMGVLKADKSLTLMARDHAIYSGQKGIMGHEGRNGKSFPGRLDRFKPDIYYGAENCTYGYNDAFDAFMSLLVDAGVESYYHRRNILNPRYNMAGVGWSSHRTYKVNCVIDFGGTIYYAQKG